MRAWLYDWIASDEDLWPLIDATNFAQAKDHITPRRGEANVTMADLPRPFLVYGLGNSTNEQLADGQDHIAERQFFQVWIHDEGGDYTKIEDIIKVVKHRLIGVSHPPSLVSNILYLETSQEFSNETYNTIFRYIRFQAIISQGAAA